MNASDASLYTVPDSIPVCCLDVREAFNGLTPKERLYAHNIAMASWAGGLIALIQASPESPTIFAGLTELFCACDAAALEANCRAAGVSDVHFNAFMQYAASFYGNLGNYLSFGDTKFVPSVPRPVFETIVKASGSSGAASLLLCAIDKVYSLNSSVLQLGFTDSYAMTSYYSSNMRKADVEIVQRWMTSALPADSSYNTRIFMNPDGSMDLRVAAADHRDGGTHSFEGRTIRLIYGDPAFVPSLNLVAKYIDAAKAHCANDKQREMLTKYSPPPPAL